MTGKKMEKAIEFILDQQAKFEATQQRFQEESMQLAQESIQLRREAEIDRKEIRAAISQIVEQANSDRQVMREVVGEMRFATGKFSDIVENVRDFSQQVAKLNVNTTRRVSKLERRVSKLEKH